MECSTVSPIAVKPRPTTKLMFPPVWITTELISDNPAIQKNQPPPFRWALSHASFTGGLATTGATAGEITGGAGSGGSGGRASMLR